MKRKLAALAGLVEQGSVIIGDDAVAAGFTQRVLMSLVVDLGCLLETVERIKVQVFAMANEEGVHIPVEED